MNEPEEIKEERRAGRYVLTAVLILMALLVWLLLQPGGSGAAQAARRAIFGGAVAGAGGAGDGLPDPDAANSVQILRPDASIGRLPDSLGERKPGDEVRPGAAGRDEPAGRVGNSRDTAATNLAGGNPGNSFERDSVVNPGGNDSKIGPGGGDGGIHGKSQTNTVANALLLDDFSERLRQAGARSGDVQVSLEWKNINDLDLHVVDPNGEEIFYNHRESQSGGVLDVDMNVQPTTVRPVENVYWPERGAPRGTYRVEVIHFRNHGGPDPTPFTVRVINKGEASYYRGAISYGVGLVRARVAVGTFTVR